MTNRSIFAFIAGAMLGAAGMWFYAKRYYEYNAVDDGVEEDEESSEVPEQAVPHELKKADDTMTVAYHKAAEQYTAKEEEPKPGPYQITPDEFGESKFNVTFLYYDDGVVTDEMGDIVEDVEEAIGTEFVNWFGEYEEDTAFVRNDKRHCDYEILREGRNYNKDSEPPTEG
ncbi:MAG: hypothetical protein J6U54_03570 [Clostridiales bacterium]|nr:hypothetical protein [Clostridiales bacterium]